MPVVGGGARSDQGQVSFGPISLEPSVARTIVRLAAASNDRVKILGFGFYLDGTSNSVAPVALEIGRISADGAYASSGSPGPDEEELSTSFATAIGLNATAEPTYSSFLRCLTIHPQSGMEYLAPPGWEVRLKAGGMLGFRATSQFSVNIRGYVMFQEGA